MRVRLYHCLACILLIASSRLFAGEPLWTRVLSGDVAAGPLSRADRIFLSGSDRTVTCLSEKGAFLWSRPVPGKSGQLLTVLKSGIVLASSGSGTITALNVDGLFLWRVNGADSPLVAPYEGRDGRIFLIYRNRIVCISPTASVKWTVPLAETPGNIVSETGSGDLLVSLSSDAIIRVSPFGQLLERVALSETPTKMAATGSGFVCGFTTGIVRCYDVRDGRTGPARKATEAIWEYRTGSSIVSFALGEGTLCVLSRDGNLCGINVTDGTLLWKSGTGIGVAGSASIDYGYGQFNVMYRGFSCARTVQGRPVWDLTLPLGVKDPVLGENGIAITVDSSATISAYRAEARIVPEKKAQKCENYGILIGSFEEYGFPGAEDQSILASFFERVSADIIDGNVGTDENFYARKLSGILQNGNAATPVSREYDQTERARAASLLGRLGSSEYRDVLFDAAKRERDPSVRIGILYGISALGPDTDGKAIEAVSLIARESGIDNSPINRASCDALYSIVRYTGGSVALQGAALLSRFAQSPYGNLDREYARGVMANILQ